MTSARPVAVVTGGGGGIGAAIAEELGRHGWHVATADPLVSVDGSGRLEEPAETTASRIVAAGGSAEATDVSVTDAGAVASLCGRLAAERGRLDAVVNVAGISRPTGFGRGAEADWRAVLEVHLGGYLNVLRAALPVMAAAGGGRVIGVTSGSGWRAADAGAYSCAKRAVAALTWQLGRAGPAGVAINAISPIAYTRMVAGAVARSGPAARAEPGRPSPTGGLSLASMPDPAELGPLAARLAGGGLDRLHGQVVFTAGAEIAVVERPRLMEVVAFDGGGPLEALVDAVLPAAFAPAETAQATLGGSNARFAGVWDPSAGHPSATEAVPSPGAAPGPVVCAVVTDRPDLAGALTDRLARRGVTCRPVPPVAGFDAAAAALEAAGPVDAVVIALSGTGGAGDVAAVSGTGDPGAVSGTGGPGGASSGQAWVELLADHGGLVEAVLADASWAGAAAAQAASHDREVRLVTVVDATSPGGVTRAQAAAQAARVAGPATRGRVSAFAVSLEAGADRAGPAAGALVGHLLTRPGGSDLAGAELVVGPGWIGLRSHPRPAASAAWPGPGLPDWLDSVVAEMAR